MRLVIGGPTLATVPASFALDLAQLYETTVRRGPWSSVTLGYVGATYVHVGREAVLEQALRCHATHVLWLDTDMACPPDTAMRLAHHDRPIVAVNGVMKDPRSLCTALRGGHRVPTTATSTGLEEVDAVGLAVCLMRTTVVGGLERPWFQHQRTAAGVDIGEDISFCAALRRAGVRIQIDHDLSKEIGHVGLHTYRLDSSALALHG